MWTYAFNKDSGALTLYLNDEVWGQASARKRRVTTQEAAEWLYITVGNILASAPDMESEERAEILELVSRASIELAAASGATRKEPSEGPNMN